MDTLIHADIFFFVTTIAVVLITIVLIIVLVYIALILRQVRAVMEEVKDETVLVRGDIKNLRENIKEGGMRLKYFTQFFNTIFKAKTSRSKEK